MDINIVAVGRIKEKYLEDGIAEYTKRLSAYGDVKIIEIKEEGDDGNRESSIRKEEEKILKVLDKEKGCNILLDLDGKHYDSIGFSKKLEELMNCGNSRFNFIIGGSYGVSDKIRENADIRLKFSEFTFPHQLMRLILAEQLYRWFSILNNGKYHK